MGWGPVALLDRTDRRRRDRIADRRSGVLETGSLGFRSVVGRAGFEPTTNGLKVRCSTD